MIDVDSTICEVVGKAEQGASYGYTHVLGYHPLLATIAGTGEIDFTAIGNILMQARGLGYVESLSEMRKIVSDSFGVIQYLPVNVSDWEENYLRFKVILSLNNPPKE